MNYLAHAYRFLEDPYFVAGTALPDWMNVVDRRNRARRQRALALVEDPDPRRAALAHGCVQHHDDDRWFHTQDSFLLLSTQFAVEIRQFLSEGLGHQAAFLGHISVELLLDAVLIEDDPSSLEAYYRALQQLEPDLVESAASHICPKPVTTLQLLIPRFVQERFLADYVNDASLLFRLNQVMRRVRLPELPVDLSGWLASARIRVRHSADQLLPSDMKRPESGIN